MIRITFVDGSPYSIGYLTDYLVDLLYQADGFF